MLMRFITDLMAKFQTRGIPLLSLISEEQYQLAENPLTRQLQPGSLKPVSKLIT